MHASADYLQRKPLSIKLEDLLIADFDGGLERFRPCCTAPSALAPFGLHRSEALDRNSMLVEVDDVEKGIS